jgi:hypothetical protein
VAAQAELQQPVAAAVQPALEPGVAAAERAPLAAMAPEVSLPAEELPFYVVFPPVPGAEPVEPQLVSGFAAHRLPFFPAARPLWSPTVAQNMLKPIILPR